MAITTRYPSVLPGVTSNTPVFFGGPWGVEGPVSLTTGGSNNAAQNNLLTQWFTDTTTNSTFSGTVATPGGVLSSTGVLTLTTPATGRMWEGEVLSCVPFSLTCSLGVPGPYIQSIASGVWGASGSTYNLVAETGLIANISSAIPITNGIYFTGSGGTANVGPFADQNVQAGTPGSQAGGLGPHGGSGQQGMGRVDDEWRR